MPLKRGDGAETRATAFEFAEEQLVVISVPTGLDSGLLDVLTTAERDVVAGVFKGFSNAAIAASRGTSPRTVANQLASVFSKLRIGSRAELAAVLADESFNSDR